MKVEREMDGEKSETAIKALMTSEMSPQCRLQKANSKTAQMDFCAFFPILYEEKTLSLTLL